MEGFVFEFSLFKMCPWRSGYPALGNSTQHVVYLGDRLSWRMCQGDLARW